MPGRKPNEENREKVKSLMYLHPDASIKEISRQSGVPDSTIRDYLKDESFLDEDIYAQYREQKKKEFINKAFDIALFALNVAEKKLKGLYEDTESLAKANVRDIAIAMGTIYDKQALASGEATIISENKQPLPEAVSTIDDKVSKLKELISA